ncbi:hypothetical protein Poli38472_009110 [Pythium oligandrum]|uniref:Uncharacterized protein n=1 Tax=Pythium oligandrum TaxID=41045 RepID=A0A8K1CMB7_PYTOL|nr:hypothetical protein Poli38472_009110 [Pythium oligandrum]|eukprot:TMW64943.1 hypothetical protein Poli38472_009110 [Pythium oligandrum]
MSVLLLTPLPCLLFVTLADVPTLQAPTSGIAANYVFWIRAAIAMALMGGFNLLLFKHYINGLDLGLVQLVAVSLLTSVCVLVTTMSMSAVIGFPLPFMVLCSGLPFELVLMSSVAVMWGKTIRQSPVAQKQMRNAMGIVFTLGFLRVIYPAYNAGFARLDGLAQGVYALGLPVIKILTKNMLVRNCGELQDAKPEIVVVNVETFHALFSTYCMQSSTSSLTIAVIMGVDVFHAWLSLRDVDTLADEIRALKTRRANGSVDDSTPPLFGQVLVCFRKTSKRVEPVNSSPHNEKLHLPSVVGPRDDCTELIMLKSELRQTIDEKTRRLLHLTEFVILVEYIEIIVPTIFSIYLVICFQLPNHVYYPQLRDINASKLTGTVARVLVYALLELVSLVVLSVCLRRKVVISPLYQLAFVLEKQWQLVQFKLSFWMLFTVMQALEHAGADYTFQFKWLQKTGAH